MSAKMLWQAPPASPLHWNWDGGQAAILYNWIRDTANSPAAVPLPIRGGRGAQGGDYFLRVHWKIY